MAKRKPAAPAAHEDLPQRTILELEVPLAPAVAGVTYDYELADRGQVAIEQPGAHVNVNLGPDTARTFLRLRNGLRAANAKLADGRPVFHGGDVLRWLLEQIDAAASLLDGDVNARADEKFEAA